MISLSTQSSYPVMAQPSPPLIPPILSKRALKRRDFERDQIMKTVDEWRSKSMAGASLGSSFSFWGSHPDYMKIDSIVLYMIIYIIL